MWTTSKQTRPRHVSSAACPDICPSHEAIKQRKQNTLKDVDADQIGIYLQEARSPRRSFLLDPSHAAYDIGRLERGNASKTNRKSCVRTPPGPRLCDRPFDFHVTASLLGTIATAFCRDGQLERPGDVICGGNRRISAVQAPSSSAHPFARSLSVSHVKVCDVHDASKTVPARRRRVCLIM